MAVPRTIAERRIWAEEHLLYEVATLRYATERLAVGLEDMEEYAFLESFLLHARCLNDFLWRDRNPNHPHDAFASDFCVPGEWERARAELPQANLQEIRKRRRFGLEVMHLSYERRSGYGDHKRWPCGKVFVEIALALTKLGFLAVPEAFDEKTRSRLVGILGELPLESGIQSIGGATGADAAILSLSTRYDDITRGGGRRRE